jgi:tetratricopeptide (TPR) repeat protein
MNTIRQRSVILLIALTACTSADQRRTIQATAELSLSSAAKEKSDYRTALKYAQQASELAPGMESARFAVASLADYMCIPNAQTDEESAVAVRRNCNLAIDEYKSVLKINSSHLDATKNLAYVLWELGKIESQIYYRRALALAPNDPEALAAIAANDASLSWKDLWPRKVSAGVPADKPSIGFPWCAQARQNNLDRVNEGIAFFIKALDVQTDNLDFMSWLSMLYTIRADLQCGNPNAYREDMRLAEKWANLRDADYELDRRSASGRYPPGPPPAFRRR